MKKPVSALILGFAACIGGGPGDDSSVRAFYPTVKVGMSLVDVVIAGEKAQAYDIRYWVLARNCPSDFVEVVRESAGPYVKITHPPPDPARGWEQGHDQTGYANREEFAAGLPKVLPRFYECGEFQFLFGRYQGWPKSDSFRVSVGPDGKIKSVGDLVEDRID